MRAIENADARGTWQPGLNGLKLSGLERLGSSAVVTVVLRTEIEYHNSYSRQPGQPRPPRPSRKLMWAW